MRVSAADELDGSPAQLDRARGGTDHARELCCPGAELRQVDLEELDRVGYRLPERERPLEVRVSLREPEDRLCLACRLDGRGERLRAATRGRPVGCQLRCFCRPTARQLLGEPRMQLFPLAGQDGGVDRLRQERVPEAE